MSKDRPHKIQICSHAKDKIKERNINEDDIKTVLYYPDRVKPARKRGRKKAERMFDSGAYTVQVVYSIEKDQFGPIFNVITVIKIKKRGGRR